MNESKVFSKTCVIRRKITATTKTLGSSFDGKILLLVIVSSVIHNNSKGTATVCHLLDSLKKWCAIELVGPKGTFE